MSLTHESDGVFGAPRKAGDHLTPDSSAPRTKTAGKTVGPDPAANAGAKNPPGFEGSTGIEFGTPRPGVGGHLVDESMKDKGQTTPFTNRKMPPPRSTPDSWEHGGVPERAASLAAGAYNVGESGVNTDSLR